MSEVKDDVVSVESQQQQISSLFRQSNYEMKMILYSEALNIYNVRKLFRFRLIVVCLALTIFGIYQLFIKRNIESFWQIKDLYINSYLQKNIRQDYCLLVSCADNLNLLQLAKLIVVVNVLVLNKAKYTLTNWIVVIFSVSFITFRLYFSIKMIRILNKINIQILDNDQNAQMLLIFSIIDITLIILLSFSQFQLQKSNESFGDYRRKLVSQDEKISYVFKAWMNKQI